MSPIGVPVSRSDSKRAPRGMSAFWYSCPRHQDGLWCSICAEATHRCARLRRHLDALVRALSRAMRNTVTISACGPRASSCAKFRVLAAATARERHPELVGAIPDLTSRVRPDVQAGRGRRRGWSGPPDRPGARRGGAEVAGGLGAGRDRGTAVRAAAADGHAVRADPLTERAQPSWTPVAPVVLTAGSVTHSNATRPRCPNCDVVALLEPIIPVSGNRTVCVALGRVLHVCRAAAATQAAPANFSRSAKVNCPVVDAIGGAGFQPGSR